MKAYNFIYPLICLLGMNFTVYAGTQVSAGAQPETTTENYAGQQDTSAKTVTSATDVQMVMQMFDGQQPSFIIPKADIFIQSGNNAEDIARTAYLVYQYYRSSKIMGYDEIAIYVADNYFLNRKYKLTDDQFLEMKLFADSNRNSLIGMKAQKLELEDPAGSIVPVGNDNSDYKVLYFYDDECAACKRTTAPLLQSIIKYGKNLNITLYMIYTQDDRDRWMEYIKNSVNIFPMPAKVKTIHLWDPDMKSDFVLKYGVISTPKLFLLDRNGTIIGRDLTPNALGQVIDVHENSLSPIEMLFEQIFLPLTETDDTVAVVERIDEFFEESKDNPELFHELFYSMFQYLKTSSSYNLMQGAAYLGNKYIAGMPELWESVTFTDSGETKGSVIRADFSGPQDFIDQTALGVLMFYRNMLDRPATDLELRTPKNRKYRIYDTEAEYTVLYFYNMDCGLCDLITPEMKKLAANYHDAGVRFLAVYTGSDKNWKKQVNEQVPGWTDLWDANRKSGMFDKYDLMDVPAIYLLDKEKKTIAKDINPDILGTLLEVFVSTEPESTL